VWIRLSMNESPAFQKMKAEGKTSKAPLTESFGQWKNLKIVILALVGLTAGQAVVWYTGQFYALFFLTQALKVDGATANIMVAASLLIGTPFFIVFGSLSDKIGRKPIIMARLPAGRPDLLPGVQGADQGANPDLAAAGQEQGGGDGRPGVLVPVQPDRHRQVHQLVRHRQAGAGRRFGELRERRGLPPARPPPSRSASTVIPSYSSKGLPADEAKKKDAEFKKAVADALKAAGYPSKADPAKIDKVMVIAILTYLVILVTMVYGPIAAMLVEMFPTRIRYTSMSLPYHIGNGWFGGLLPTTAFAIVAQTGNMYNGLWYPIIIAGATFVIGTLFIKETKDVDIYAND
jgi:hypothetical protein